MKKQMAYVFVVCLSVSGVCLAVLFAGARAQVTCPPCYNDNVIREGRGTEDGRRVLNVYVEPQGWDSTEINQKMNAAALCATNRWNNSGGLNFEDKIPYKLKITTDRSEADIIIQRGLAEGGCGENNLSMGAGPDIIDLDSATQWGTDENACLLMSHEIGHSLGLDNDVSCYSIMNGVVAGSNCTMSSQASAIQANDVERVRQNFNSQSTCTSSLLCPDADGDGVTTCAGDCNDNDPTVTITCSGGSDCWDNDGDGFGVGAHCLGAQDCDDFHYYVNPGTDWDQDGYDSCFDCQDNDPWVNPGADPCFQDVGTSSTDKNCNGLPDWYECNASPILIDVAGDGFALTGGAGGVIFDLDGDGTPERLSWTSAGSDDAWLALDRDGDGTIDDGRELFGNFTPQPPSATPNGFLALAEYDKPPQGGNGDGVIDIRDAGFPSLRLWQDANHDGVSQPRELHPLASLHVASISLDYREVRRRDRHGNQFRYQATVTGTGRRVTRRLAYDVFLVHGL